MDKEKILIVCDEEAIRNSLSSFLKENGYDTDTAETGSAGLEKLEHHRFDAVILDYKRPDLDGLDLAKVVRERNPEAAIVFMTKHSSIETALKIMKIGVFDHVVKPINPEDVLSRIRTGRARQGHNIPDRQLLHNLQVKNTELETSNQMLKALSTTDSLTLLYNHRHMMDILSLEYQKARRFQKSLSVIMFDLDRFKWINDKYGHQGGDKILAAFGSFLKEQMRSIDILGRHGGDEFCAIFPETNTDGAKVIAEKIHRAIEGRLFSLAEDVTVDITACLGIGSISDEGVNSDKVLLGHADKALYEAKLRGRNCVICWADARENAKRKTDSTTDTLVTDYESYAANTAKELKNSCVQSLKTLVTALDAKDGYTATHSYLVSYYAGEIMKEQARSGEEIDIVKTAGILHDIGKIGIPDKLLKKRRKFTEGEMAIVKRHPETGVKILGLIGFLKREQELICFHQERWDGHGYPYGVKGKNIPFGARILALCDAFEAMTSARPYRKKPFTAEKSLEIITSESGKQFDPSLVEPFTKNMKKLLSKQRKLHIKELDKIINLPEI